MSETQNQVGYEYCQCGCGEKTRLAAGVHLLYAHPSHNPKWRARRHQTQAETQRLARSAVAQVQKIPKELSHQHGADHQQPLLGLDESASVIEIKKQFEHIREAIRSYKVGQECVRISGKGFHHGTRPKDIAKQSVLLTYPVRPEVWSALLENKSAPDSLLPGVMDAIKNHDVTLREVSRLLGRPLHTAGQWYRSQTLKALRSRLTPGQMADRETAFQRGNITREELLLLLEAEMKSLRFLLWKEQHKQRYNRHHREYSFRRYSRDSDFRQKKLDASTKWRTANRSQFNRTRKHWLDKTPSARLADRIRSRVRTALRAQSARKVSSIQDLIGCSIEDLRLHLEARFQRGMSWGNYGEWHVDHIVPCASFDLTEPANQRQCFHYTNLQPLWGKENIQKGARSARKLGVAP